MPSLELEVVVRVVVELRVSAPALGDDAFLGAKGKSKDDSSPATSAIVDWVAGAGTHHKSIYTRLRKNELTSGSGYPAVRVVEEAV